MTDNPEFPHESPKRVREPDEIRAMLGRMRAALIRDRVAIGDGMALEALIVDAEQTEIDLGIAVRAYHAAGFSWSEIAKLFGISRQGARQRFGA